MPGAANIMPASAGIIRGWGPEESSDPRVILKITRVFPKRETWKPA